MALGGGDLTIHGLQEEVLTVVLTEKIIIPYKFRSKDICSSI